MSQGQNIWADFGRDFYAFMKSKGIEMPDNVTKINIHSEPNCVLRITYETIPDEKIAAAIIGWIACRKMDAVAGKINNE